MEVEIVNYEEGKIYIEYMNNIDNLDGYLDGTFVYDPLSVTFVPDVVMTENQCLNFLNGIREQTIENVEELISKFNGFYEHFEISYFNFYISEQLEHETTKMKAIGKCIMNLNCRLKDSKEKL